MGDLPSVAAMRSVAQPPTVMGRASAEHWTGTLYMRRISPYVTRLLLRTPITPNGVTGLMILSGVAAAPRRVLCPAPDAAPLALGVRADGGIRLDRRVDDRPRAPGGRGGHGGGTCARHPASSKLR